jgi:hypothetical protein
MIVRQEGAAKISRLALQLFSRRTKLITDQRLIAICLELHTHIVLLNKKVASDQSSGIKTLRYPDI